MRVPYTLKLPLSRYWLISLSGIGLLSAVSDKFAIINYQDYHLPMASEKKAFVLRISAETLKELERWAQEEFRSVNGQIEYILHDALRKRKRPVRRDESEKDSTEQS